LAMATGLVIGVRRDRVEGKRPGSDSCADISASALSG
jgi:hypothetical protein